MKKANLVILCVLCASLLTGIIIGIMRAQALDAETLAAAASQAESKQLLSLSATFMRYAAMPLILWIVAFVPIGSLFAICAPALKGMSYGYTFAVLVRSMGLAGMMLGLKAFALQMLFILPLTVFVCYANICFVIALIKARKQISRKQVMDYSVALVIAAGCVAAVSVLETVIVG